MEGVVAGSVGRADVLDEEPGDTLGGAADGVSGGPGGGADVLSGGPGGGADGLSGGPGAL